MAKIIFNKHDRAWLFHKLRTIISMGNFKSTIKEWMDEFKTLNPKNSIIRKIVFCIIWVVIGFPIYILTYLLELRLKYSVLLYIRLFGVKRYFLRLFKMKGINYIKSNNEWRRYV